MYLGKFVLALILVLMFSTQNAGVVGQEPEIRNLIRDLHNHRWQGAYPVAMPLMWDLGLTDPMSRILEIGPAAQQDLIDNNNDPIIKDQIIILLGGVGDERSIGPIINAMIPQKKLRSTPNSQGINLAANIALTNITVSDVIWHYGGGVVRTEPPEDSKERWVKWWNEHHDFAVRTITHSRNYSNYPNYGIYKQP